MSENLNFVLKLIATGLILSGALYTLMTFPSLTVPIIFLLLVSVGIYEKIKEKKEKGTQ